MENSYKKAVNQGIDVRAICVINPGNPTGSILSEGEIADVLKFAHRNNLVVLADEVYQENIYETSNGKKKDFVSFRKVLKSLPSP